MGYILDNSITVMSIFLSMIIVLELEEECLMEYELGQRKIIFPNYRFNLPVRYASEWMCVFPKFSPEHTYLSATVKSPRNSE